MKLAFSLFRYFPFGGIQRDFLRIAEICADRGHELHLYTMRWDGPAAHFPLNVHLIPVTARRNHKKYEQFAMSMSEAIAAERFDLVIGFNKMPHLDAYFCGDPCYLHEAHTNRNALYRMSGRYRHFSAFERAVFAGNAGVEILLLSKREGERYQKWHGTPQERMHLLPPSVAADRFALPPRHIAREAITRELGVDRDDRLILMIGSAFKTKGVDRAIRALASLSPHELRSVHLLIVGRGHPWRFRMLAKRLSVENHVHFLQGRDDVPMFLAAADMQLHVSVKETAGVAIVEGLAAGLPIIVTAACGYAFHVQDGGAGVVIPEPFEQRTLDHALQSFVTSAEHREQCSNAAKHYAAETDLTSGTKYAAGLIEQFAAERKKRSSPMRAGVP